MRNIVHQSNYVVTAGELLDTTEDPPVQRDGYRTIEDQVREFQLAGEQLEEYRKMEYQYEGPGAEDIEEVGVFDDPDSSPADLVNAKLGINIRVQERKRIKEAMKANKSDKKEDGDASASVVDSGS